MSFSKLDRDSIVREGLALLAEEGLAQVTLRRLAGRLGVQVSSLYWHVEDRAALLSLMSESLLRSTFAAVPDASDWCGWLRNLGLALHVLQRTVRDSSQLIVSTAFSPEVKRELADIVIGRLDRFGLDRDFAAVAQLSVQALVTGWTTLRRAPFDDAAAEAAEFDLALAALLDGWARSPAAAAAPAPKVMLG